MVKKSTSKNNFALIAVCLSALMFGLEVSSVPAILPVLESVLHANFQQLQWIMNAYTLAMTACLMAAGALADRFGRKRVFSIGIAAFGLSSFACGFSPSASVLIATRFIQGASGAVMLACQIAVLSHQFRDGQERAKAFGWWGIVFGGGLGFGPLIGGLTVVVFSWEWVFLVHAVIAVAALCFARSGVLESSDPHAVRIDLVGMVALSLAVFSLVFLITRGEIPSIDDVTGLSMALVGLCSALIFIVTELRVARPMFDFAAFRNRTFSGALLGSTGMNFSFWPFVIYLPIYFQAGLGYGSIVAGSALLAYTLPTLIAPPFGERLLLRHGPRFVIPLGLFTIGTGFLLMLLATAHGDASWITILPGCIVTGTGLGLMNTPVTNTATASVPVERGGMASGMDMSARMISLAVNIALMGFILSTGVSGYLASALPNLPPKAVLHSIADMVSAGNLVASEAHGVPATIAREALTHGVAWVMLYGAICAWVLALASFIVFGRNLASRPQALSQ